MTDLTAVAAAGHAGEANPHLYSSPAFYAHALGAYFCSRCWVAPTGVRMGRGYSVWGSGMLFKAWDIRTQGAPLRVGFQLVSVPPPVAERR